MLSCMQLTALAPRPNIADKFTATAVGLFAVGESVRCVIQRVDLENERVVVTLKPALVPPSAGAASYLAISARESFLVSEIAGDSSLAGWKHARIGAIVKAVGREAP